MDSDSSDESFVVSAKDTRKKRVARIASSDSDSDSDNQRNCDKSDDHDENSSSSSEEREFHDSVDVQTSIDEDESASETADESMLSNTNADEPSTSKSSKNSFLDNEASSSSSADEFHDSVDLQTSSIVHDESMNSITNADEPSSSKSSKNSSLKNVAISKPEVNESDHSIDAGEPDVHEYSSDDAIETSYVEAPPNRLNFTVARPKANSTASSSNLQNDMTRSSINDDSNVESSFIVPDSDEEDAEIENRCFSPRTRQSIGGLFVNDVSDSDDEDDQADDDNQENGSDNISTIVKQEDENKLDRKSNMKPLESENNENVSPNISVEVVASPTEVTVVLSSDEDDVVVLSPVVRQQPPMSAAKLKYVSQKFYDDQVRLAEELKAQIARSNQMLLTLNLPDNGAAMKRNLLVMQSKLAKMNAEIALMRVSETKPMGKLGVVDDWAKITDAINAIQPVHTGARGISTFNTQKTLTMDRLHQLHDSMQTCPKEDVRAATPAGLKVELMDHQQYALAWLMWREKQRPRGGILADDMGLGKTLTMISLVLAMHEKKSDDDEEDSSSSDSDPDIEDTDDQRRKSPHYGGTLVVCPASLIGQWEDEVKNRLKRNLLTVIVHHGQKREDRPKYLARADIVITTYAIVSRECANRAALFGVRWKRIILDESHIIRNYTAKQSEACFKLKGSCRWSLTGTPIQNKEIDMFAQLKFLRCTPFDDLVVYKKWIGNQSAGNQERMNNVVQPLLLRRTKVQLQEKGTLMGLPSKSVNIVSVKLDKNEMNVYQRVMAFSKTLFSQFLHQRAGREHDNFFRDAGNKPTFMQTKAPNGAYDKMHQRVKQLHGQEDIKSHQILTYILRLRQICCHPALIDAMLEDDDGSDEHSMSLPEVDLLEQLNKLNLDPNDSNGASTSNITEEDDVISKASSKLLLRSNPVFNGHRASSKFRKALDLISNQIPVDDKVVVVSQWTSVLNMFQEHLHSARIKHVCLTGQVAVQSRNEIVNQFNSKTSGVKVMLLSLTAGGVGLNLVGANNLLLLDPHWNPQLEAQAQDRVYRVGQTKSVSIYKFLCHETIEERINALQEAKLSLARDVLAGVRHTGGSKLSIDDMKALFEI